jgi:myo-inositol-1(or 4)-monophosphatase
MGGRVLLEHLGTLKRSEASQKAVNDYVTFVDTASEREILDHLRSIFPDHSFLAEETGSYGTGSMEWIIDPLDGTKNYIHGIPWFCISIALMDAGRPAVGVVHDPVRDLFFTAERGKGAFCNGRAIHVSSAQGIDGALVATGFPFRDKSRTVPYFGTLSRIFLRASGVRRAGSAALDLAYVAQGSLDGFFEFGLSAWDIAAGSLLIREAGGIVTDIKGGDRYLESGDVVAGPEFVHRDILDQIKKEPGDQPGLR